ncbi:hypothetical protein [Paenisporosarcina indica]|uniref:hypothetical protein n=1 Tax=Paenisporosarcina indica TaxID=650093 RepID=UPI0009500BA3|nr:hypothetical protein [Paenisporosarcina indica]
MFQTKKFLQMLGIAIISTFFLSILMGLLNFDGYHVFITLQLLITYGTIGVLSVFWLPDTPYISAYLGAITMSLLNILFSYYIFNVLIFADPTGINSSMSWAVIVSMVFAFSTKFIISKKESRVPA